MTSQAFLIRPQLRQRVSSALCAPLIPALRAPHLLCRVKKVGEVDRHVAIAEAPLRGRRARVIVLAIVVNVAVIISVHRRPAGLGVAPDTVVLILILDLVVTTLGAL